MPIPAFKTTWLFIFTTLLPFAILLVYNVFPTVMFDDAVKLVRMVVAVEFSVNVDF